MHWKRKSVVSSDFGQPRRSFSSYLFIIQSIYSPFRYSATKVEKPSTPQSQYLSKQATSSSRSPAALVPRHPPAAIHRHIRFLIQEQCTTTIIFPPLSPLDSRLLVPLHRGRCQWLPRRWYRLLGSSSFFPPVTYIIYPQHHSAILQTSRGRRRARATVRRARDWLALCVAWWWSPSVAWLRRARTCAQIERGAAIASPPRHDFPFRLAKGAERVSEFWKWKFRGGRAGRMSTRNWRIAGLPDGECICVGRGSFGVFDLVRGFFLARQWYTLFILY